MMTFYFLEGRTEKEAHHQLHLPHGLWCETAYVCPWQLQQIHQGKPYLTTALTVVWLTTSNMVQASLAVLPLKNLHLRWSQTAAARSLVGPYHGSCVRDKGCGEDDFFQPGQAFFCGGLWGWILDWTQVMLWDVDLKSSV